MTVFFFKQKTAYEMRISDWSSDVCSSDLTMLHAVINRPGVYDGFSANYSGAGFSGMRFKFHGLDSAGFDRWVATAKASGRTLDRAAYTALARPSENVPVMRFATVEIGRAHV